MQFQPSKTQVRETDERLFCSTRQEQTDKTIHRGKSLSGPVECKETGGLYQLSVN